MAGMFSWQNWKNLVVGKGAPKGAGKGAPTTGPLYPDTPGEGNLPNWQMSNRLKVLCKDFEDRKEKEEKDKQDKTMETKLEEMMVARGLTGKRKGSHTTPSPKKKTAAAASPALGTIRPGDDDDNSGSDEEEDDKSAVKEIATKEAYMSATDVEKIAKKMGVTVTFGKDKNKPVALSEAATEIASNVEFSRKKWAKGRQKLFGLSASSAGSRMSETAIVASTLSGYLGKHAQVL